VVNAASRSHPSAAHALMASVKHAGVTRDRELRTVERDCSLGTIAARFSMKSARESGRWPCKAHVSAIKGVPPLT
jgi:hypothetical protein